MPLHTSLEQDGLDYLLVDLAFLHFIKDEDCHEPVSSRFILDQDSDNSDSEIFRRSLRSELDKGLLLSSMAKDELGDGKGNDGETWSCSWVKE
ncbi:hypothetical protein V6N12_047064 [Hibiscus sabdariffa]|uniref:Uncharacterized protein n=1 Tax=Hibiscus sabdariffa TaxID=183260 RepID=A0ABR2A7M2_9ROSI